MGLGNTVAYWQSRFERPAQSIFSIWAREEPKDRFDIRKEGYLGTVVKKKG